MSLALVFTRLMEIGAADWLSPLSSPMITLATNKLATLLWAYQLQGMACCIPLIAFMIGKIVNVKWNELLTGEQGQQRRLPWCKRRLRSA